MNLTTLIGILASVFTAISLLPQLIKMIKSKTSDDVSDAMLITLFIGLAFWVYYGFLLRNWILIISNAFSLVINFIILVFNYKYAKK
jgi:MtN3 and saliva related transmembrane protein